jgi:hypothetical protein
MSISSILLFIFVLLIAFRPPPCNELFNDDDQRSRRIKATNQVLAKTGGVVCSGPFKGLKLTQNNVWGDDDIGAKLLGTYEHVIHESISKYLAQLQDIQGVRVINVGCADGFYAVGFAKFLPLSKVFAYDVLENARDALSRNMHMNNLDTSRVQFIHMTMTSTELQFKLDRARSLSLVVIDCEGCEDSVLDVDRCPSLEDAFVIVESHDFVIPSITPTLIERFKRTHVVEVLTDKVDDSRQDKCHTPKPIENRTLGSSSSLGSGLLTLG